MMMDIEQLYEIFKSHPSVAIDSRKVKGGTLFFALQGINSDGNSFATKALEAGAPYAIIDNPAYNNGDERLILVDDVLKTLQQLANYHRRQFEIPIIAITGSNGKTTTKELVSAVLAKRYSTHFTQGNFNNHIGLPLTLLEMSGNTEVAVIEMGANHIGEIDALCRIAEPTHGIITNIGKAHLEGFGSLDGVKQGKSELYKYLAIRGGTAFVNLEEDHLQELSKIVAHCVYYKKSKKIDPTSRVLETRLLAEAPFLKAGFQNEQKLTVDVESQLIGGYNFNNIITAISIGRYFKVPALQIKEAIETYVPKHNRSQILQIGSNTYILDAYNANPSSMRQAIQHFDKADYDHKTVIIGDMLELGSHSTKEHQEIIGLAKKAGFERIILVGPILEKVCKERDSIKCFPDVGSLKAWFEEQDFEQATFLLKGSRGIGLEKLVDGMSVNQ